MVMKIFSFLLIAAFAITNAFAQKEQPMMDWVHFGKYSNENSLLPKRKAGTQRVVFMGNSITEMWKITDSSFFQKNNFICRGIGGEGTAQMLLRFRQDVIDIGATVVVIKAGINDIAENVGPMTDEQIVGYIINMAELAKANNIRPIIASILPANIIPWKKEIYPADRVIRINQMLKGYCAKNHFTYVDYYSALVDDKKGLPEKYSYDGVHVNLQAYKVMEELVLKAIKRI